MTVEWGFGSKVSRCMAEWGFPGAFLSLHGSSDNQLVNFAEVGSWSQISEWQTKSPRKENSLLCWAGYLLPLLSFLTTLFKGICWPEYFLRRKCSLAWWTSQTRHDQLCPSCFPEACVGQAEFPGLTPHPASEPHGWGGSVQRNCWWHLAAWAWALRG